MRIIYEDDNLLVIDKPARINSDDFEKRVHRLDKDTSGILLIAKNDKTLEFLQKQFTPLEITSDSGSSLFPKSLTGFKNRKVIKKYIALVIGNLKSKEGTIETLLGRSPKDSRKQKVYLAQEPKAAGKRKAITKYRVLERFDIYTLIEVQPQTGRKHQIRTHLAYLGHPIAGDKLYGFKNQPCPKELKRQFLHASYLKIELPDKGLKEFESSLPEELEEILAKIRSTKHGFKLKTTT